MQLGSNLGSLWDRFGIMFRGCWDKLSHHLNLNDYAPCRQPPRQGWLNWQGWAGVLRLAGLGRVGWPGWARLGPGCQRGQAGLGRAGLRWIALERAGLGWARNLLLGSDESGADKTKNLKSRHLQRRARKDRRDWSVRHPLNSDGVAIW